MRFLQKEQGVTIAEYQTGQGTREAGISPNQERTETNAEDIIQPKFLNLEQDTAGGLGRHLGLFSTTFLMSVLSSWTK